MEKGRVFIAHYSNNEFVKEFEINHDNNGFIIVQHVTPGNIHDNTQLKLMVERFEEKNMLPITLAVDSG
ncbi:hypothetical protein [Mammaliicoccus sp. I-M36]|uniref:hypothetical protein n=1 Tax=Mammaliicoccus sp. I-M36 TaxID=2898695 RepID=UPI001EFC06F0|nr:hypothetical protein [Mammaliicoccus sp. I-M36]